MPLPNPTVTTPVVSVVMPAFNSERFVDEAIQSIRTQSFTEIELVVVDDGSTDGTATIVAEHAANDPRVVMCRQENRGVAAASNLAVSMARAPLIARLDADDVAMPDRLERQRRFLEENGSVALVGGGVAVMDENGRAFAEVSYPSSDAKIRETMSTSTPFVHSTVMMRRDLFEGAGQYRQPFAPAEDLDLYLRIAERGTLANLGTAVARYRVHENQASAQSLEQQAIRSLAARVSARCRMAGRPDPFDECGHIDESALLSNGVAPEEIDAAVVRSGTWLAKTLDRAGYQHAADSLFLTVRDRARSSSNPAELMPIVRRAFAVRHAEKGHRIRAKLDFARATAEERLGRRGS